MTSLKLGQYVMDIVVTDAGIDKDVKLSLPLTVALVTGLPP